MSLWRVQRYLAAAGLGSRRRCEALIAAGRVKVDGVLASLGMKVDPSASRVEVDEQRVLLGARKYYVAVHKPVGYLVTKADPRGRETVMSLLYSLPYASLLNPVGRLDMDSEGLLLLTNDGELAHRLTHPSYEVKKTYEVTTKQKPSARQLEALREGFLLDGRMTAPGEAHIVGGVPKERRRPGLTVGERYWRVCLRIHEGRNRQVRRMFKHLGLSVVNLRRTAVGPVCLGRLPMGAHRRLTREEVVEVKRAVGLT